MPSQFSEYVELVRVIESPEFTVLPAPWRSRGTWTPDRSPGRVGPGPDLVYYDPHLRQCVAASVPLARAGRARLVILAGLPVGYDFLEDDVRGWGVDVEMEVSDRLEVWNESDVDMDVIGTVLTPGVSSNLAAVRRFLRACGVSEEDILCDCEELRGFVRGRLA